MSAQQLVSVMGKNTQVNPMLMKNDMSFVQSLYDTGVAPLQGPITNKNKDMFQNQERIQSMIDLKNYTIFMNEYTTNDLNLLLNSDQNYQILVNNTNAPGPGTDITVTINNNGPTSGGSCDVLAAAARMIFFTIGVFICP